MPVGEMIEAQLTVMMVCQDQIKAETFFLKILFIYF